MIRNQKKTLLIFFITITVGVGFLPLINIIKNPKQLSLEALYNTDVIESYYNLSIYKLLRKSTNPNNVIIGKNGDMFLGNKHNKLIYKTIGVYPYKKSQIENWSKNLLHLQRWYENQGIAFILVVAPNKHSIYAENLPQWIIPEENNITDQLVAASKKLNTHVLDLRSILINNKTKHNELLYWRSDSHWNELGASIGFRETIERLNSLYNKTYKLPTYQFITKTDQPNGGHARFLKIQHLLPPDFETWVYRVIADENTVCIGAIKPDTFVESQCEMKLRPYLDIHQGPVYITNEEALNSDSVLILSDSFIMQNSNLYNKTFKKVWYHKYNYLRDDTLKDFINLKKPDVVIYQVVERSLFNNYFIDIKNLHTD